MSLSQELRKQASEIASSSPEFVAIGLLKKAGLSEERARLEVAQSMMEKAAVEQLIEGGVPQEQAEGLVKAAGVKLSELGDFSPEASMEEQYSGHLEKIAAQVEVLEKEMAKLATELESMTQRAVEAETVQTTKPDYIQKLACSGKFTNEDLEALQRLPQDTLTKVASASEEPWGMGKASGMDKSTMDPLAEFLMG